MEGRLNGWLDLISCGSGKLIQKSKKWKLCNIRTKLVATLLDANNVTIDLYGVVSCIFIYSFNF